jgi:CxxC motif-containing protein
VGCRLEVRGSVDEGLDVEGNRCPKGVEYGREEATSPKRVVTAVVRTDSGEFPYAPVRTTKPLPRALMRELLQELSRMRVRLPVALGDELFPDFRETGVGVVFTRTLPPDDVPPVG